MKPTRPLLFTGAALLLLAVVAPAAMAAPTTALAPVPASVHAGRVHVGFGIGVTAPVHAPRRTVVVAPPPRGHYEIRIERVWVPGEFVGYDAYGYPVHTRGYWTERRVRVWVPHRGRIRHARRVIHPVAPAPVTHVGFGVRYVR